MNLTLTPLAGTNPYYEGDSGSSPVAETTGS